MENELEKIFLSELILSIRLNVCKRYIFQEKNLPIPQLRLVSRLYKFLFFLTDNKTIETNQRPEQRNKVGEQRYGEEIETEGLSEWRAGEVKLEWLRMQKGCLPVHVFTWKSKRNKEENTAAQWTMLN